MVLGKVAAVAGFLQAAFAVIGVVGSTATADGFDRPRDAQFWALEIAGLVVALLLVGSGLLLVFRQTAWPLAVAALASLALTAWWYFWAFSDGRGDWEILAFFAALPVVVLVLLAVSLV